MTYYDYIFTDRKFDKTEYFLDEMGVDARALRFICVDDNHVLGVRFSKEDVFREMRDSLFPDLICYRVVHCAANFEYCKKRKDPKEDTILQDAQKDCLVWFLRFSRRHLRSSGAKKFYYAHMWLPSDEKPVMRSMDLSTFTPDENEFKFGRQTVWEFADPTMKR